MSDFSFNLLVRFGYCLFSVLIVTGFAEAAEFSRSKDAIFDGIVMTGEIRPG